MFPRLAALALAATACLAQNIPLPAREDFHLYLLVGQSNMAGRGKVAPEDRAAHPRVLMLTQAGEWTPAVDPMHFDKPIAGVGLGRTFGLLAAEADPSKTIGLIPCAVGGSPIDTWNPGVFYPPTRSHPWDDAIARARIALRAGVLKAILWHQGESDSTAELAPGYEAKLHALIARFRKELNAPDAPFLAGQLGQFPDAPRSEPAKIIDRVHRDLPAKVERTAFVSAEGLGHNGDRIHFDADSYRELGRRYWTAFQKLGGSDRFRASPPH